MSNTRFLHVADVHLDSPLANLKRLDQATADRLRQASRQSWEAVVEAALLHEVALVAIAGDLFDGPVKDAAAGLWIGSQLKRLTRAGIQVALIRGNHDAVSNAARIADWPEGVFEFGSATPETLHLESAGIAVHGQSFGARVEAEDLAARYPAALPGYFNLGLLHTSLAGSGSHDTYAPTSLSTLENMGYDYWALGHIHQRSQASLSETCYVGYSGNTQGRHIREQGAKGCQLVEVCDGKLTGISFVPTDSLRWEEVELDLSELDDLRDIEDELEQPLSGHVERAEGRPLAVRVRLTGNTRLHAVLTRPGTLERLVESLGHRFSELGDVWVEAVKVATAPSMERSSDETLLPLKYLSQVSDACRNDQVIRKELAGVLEELLKKARHDLATYDAPVARSDDDDEELLRLISSAEDMLVARLVAGGEA